MSLKSCNMDNTSNEETKSNTIYGITKMRRNAMKNRKAIHYYPLLMFTKRNCVSNSEELAILSSCVYCMISVFVYPFVSESIMLRYCLNAKYMECAERALSITMEDEYKMADCYEDINRITDDMSVLRERINKFIPIYVDVLMENNLVGSNFNITFPDRLVDELYGNRPIFHKDDSQYDDIYESYMFERIERIIMEYNKIVNTY